MYKQKWVDKSQDKKWQSLDKYKDDGYIPFFLFFP